MPGMKKEMNMVANVAVNAVRGAARDIPSKQRRSKDSLRSALARGVKKKLKETKNDVTAVITCKGSGGNPKANLARAVDGEIPWRHPTFGHDPVVDQKSHEFFYSTLDSLEPGMKRALRRGGLSYEKEL